MNSWQEGSRRVDEDDSGDSGSSVGCCETMAEAAAKWWPLWLDRWNSFGVIFSGWAKGGGWGERGGWVGQRSGGTMVGFSLILFWPSDELLEDTIHPFNSPCQGCYGRISRCPKDSCPFKLTSLTKFVQWFKIYPFDLNLISYNGLQVYIVNKGKYACAFNLKCNIYIYIYYPFNLSTCIIICPHWN